MKTDLKIVIFILVLAVVGLGTVMLVQNKRSAGQINAAKAEVARLTADRDAAQAKLKDAEKVIAKWEADLAKRDEDLAAKTAELTKLNTEFAVSKADYKLTQAELQKQTARAVEMEGQRDELAKKMEDLTTSINNKNLQIAEIQKKLANSEGDRKFLLAQLKQLETEKEELLAQFTNLAALRVQVAKIKEEAAISQRLAWMRAGIYDSRDKKGAENLFAESARKEKTENRLNIELEQNGGGKVK